MNAATVPLQQAFGGASLSVLYLGHRYGTSGYRAAALRRLGHQVEIVDPYEFLPRLPGIGAYAYLSGGAIVSTLVARATLKRVSNRSFDVAWIDGGALVGAALVRALRARGMRTVNYNHDDPFGERDWVYWRQYRRAVPEYDLLAVVRTENIAEARRAGAKNVMHIFRSADEVAHAPQRLTVDETAQWASEVLFVGTWMPERGPFMRDLLLAGVPLAIYGNGWHKDRDWSVLAKAWRGAALDTTGEYARAIQSAKICLGLLSKGNRDLHTTRSLEIPSLGGLLLAQRTSEHLLLYRENEEAVFWTDAGECAQKCRWLLADDTLRRRIAAAGRRRAFSNAHFNETAVASILAVLGFGRSDAQ